MNSLRFTTWLAPGLPRALFERIAAGVGDALGCGHALQVESKISGPLSEEDDRFAQARTDVGFLCAPAFLWLSEREPSSIDLVPHALVFDDPRNEGHPVFFSDVVVRHDSAVRSLDDLLGCRVGFNDRASLSGYLSLLGALAERGLDAATFFRWRCVGSHRAALHAILAGDIDAAAIDGNVLTAWSRESRERASQLRTVEALGPFPVQPIVVRSSLPSSVGERVSQILADGTLTASLKDLGVRGFAPISAAAYNRVANLMQLTQ